MIEPRVATLSQMRRIATCDNKEALVSLIDTIPCDPRHEDMLPYTGEEVFVRASVKEKILAAQETLLRQDPRLTLCIAYGYRHPKVQSAYYKEMSEKMRKKYSAEELEEQVHQLIAHPSVAGHPTGGAIDVTILYEGQELDMGCPLYAFDQLDKIPTFSKAITEEQRQNRMLLHDVLTKQHFAPFYGEWWHFSYGDLEWAAFYRQKHALYEQVDFTA